MTAVPSNLITGFEERAARTRVSFDLEVQTLAGVTHPLLTLRPAPIREHRIAPFRTNTGQIGGFQLLFFGIRAEVC
jgi:hypothetical protein